MCHRRAVFDRLGCSTDGATVMGIIILYYYYTPMLLCYYDIIWQYEVSKNLTMIGIVENWNNYFIRIPPNSMQYLTLLLRTALAHFIKLYMLIIYIIIKYIISKLTQNPWLEATRSTATRSRNCKVRITISYSYWNKKKINVEPLY